MPFEPGPSPLRLAEMVIEDLALENPDDVQRHRGIVLSAGDYIEEEFGPGEWRLFEAEDYYRLHANKSDHERVGIGMILHALFSTLASYGLVSPRDCLRIVRGVYEAAPRSPALTGVHDQTLRLLEEVEDHLTRELH